MSDSSDVTKAGAPRKRRPGGGRKALSTGAIDATLSIRITKETRTALDAVAAKAGVSLSRATEGILADGLRVCLHPEQAEMEAAKILSGWVGDDLAVSIIKQFQHRGLVIGQRASAGDAKNVDA